MFQNIAFQLQHTAVLSWIYKVHLATHKSWQYYSHFYQKCSVHFKGICLKAVHRFTGMTDDRSRCLSFTGILQQCPCPPNTQTNPSQTVDTKEVSTLQPMKKAKGFSGREQYAKQRKKIWSTWIQNAPFKGTPLNNLFSI